MDERFHEPRSTKVWLMITHWQMDGQWQPTNLLHFFELETPLSSKPREAVKDQH